MSFPNMNEQSTPFGVPLLRRRREPASAGRTVQLAALRVPLLVKLVGANLLVTAILLSLGRRPGLTSGIVGVVVAISVALHTVLTVLALRPIRDLEVVASRVWEGDLGARVERSAIADQGVVRVGSMFNILLDGLATERSRMRSLAAQVIATGDRERAAIAHELHDSTAQLVAALQLQLAASARDAAEPELAARLRAARDSAEEILEEVRRLAYTAHPRVLDDLGLEAALRKLARDSSHGNGIDIDVNAKRARNRFPATVEATLFRVAEEAVLNATRHASPRQVQINLIEQHPSVTLEIHDDGCGFDLADAERRGAGAGLLSMRERVALLDGRLDIRTSAGSGTTVSATVPLDAAPNTVH
jgi:signal transduction histidine kinase